GRLPPDRLARLGIRVIEARAREAAPRTLELVGTLALEPDRLARVRSRFAGEGVEVRGPDGKAGPPPLRAGDLVKKRQLLAVVWSKELGGKTGALVDPVLGLRLDRHVLSRVGEVFREGAVREAAFRQAQRQVGKDQLAVARAERTLRTWGLSAEDLRALGVVA